MRPLKKTAIFESIHLDNKAPIYLVLFLVLIDSHLYQKSITAASTYTSSSTWASYQPTANTFICSREKEMAHPIEEPELKTQHNLPILLSIITLVEKSARVFCSRHDRHFGFPIRRFVIAINTVHFNQLIH